MSFKEEIEIFLFFKKIHRYDQDVDYYANLIRLKLRSVLSA